MYKMTIKDKPAENTFSTEHESKSILVDIFCNWYLGRVLKHDYTKEGTADADSWIETIGDMSKALEETGSLQCDMEDCFDFGCIITIEEIR